MIADDFDHDINDVSDHGCGNHSECDDCNDHDDRSADYCSIDDGYDDDDDDGDCDNNNHDYYGCGDYSDDDGDDDLGDDDLGDDDLGDDDLGDDDLGDVEGDCGDDVYAAHWRSHKNDYLFAMFFNHHFY